MKREIGFTLKATIVLVIVVVLVFVLFPWSWSHWVHGNVDAVSQVKSKNNIDVVSQEMAKNNTRISRINDRLSAAEWEQGIERGFNAIVQEKDLLHWVTKSRNTAQDWLSALERKYKELCVALKKEIASNEAWRSDLEGNIFIEYQYDDYVNLLSIIADGVRLASQIETQRFIVENFNSKTKLALDKVVVMELELSNMKNFRMMDIIECEVLEIRDIVMYQKNFNSKDWYRFSVSTKTNGAIHNLVINDNSGRDAKELEYLHKNLRMGDRIFIRRFNF